MKKRGLAKLGETLGKISNGTIKTYRNKRKPVPEWNVSKNGSYMIKNIQIIDVKKGQFKKEDAILIRGKKIQKLMNSKEADQLESSHNIEWVMDGKKQYLIPGLSDIHAHLSLISEYDMKLSSIYFHDAQRELNCELALSKGCTFVRDSGGAYDMIHGLTEAINSNKLLGPKIFPSYEVMTPKGGMWDVNKFVNKMSEMIFGGRILNYPKTDEDIINHVNRMQQMGANSIKIYLEERPLYGGREDTIYKMFPDNQVRLVRNMTKGFQLPLESHAMFISGARKAIKGSVNSIAHLTVDEPYTLMDAIEMAKNHVGIVPTLSIGGFLSMNFGKAGYTTNKEVQFYRGLLHKYIAPLIKEGTVTGIRNCYENFFHFVDEEKAFRKMPSIGTVYPERVHGFAIHAPESFKNFLKAGVKIGMGTDGGTGLTFTGCLDVEFEGYQRYGMSPAEILRCATLTNMEILNLDYELGSIDEGKYADMVILEKNPLETIDAIQNVQKVFKDGRLYIDYTS